jgi:hypothetical protein
MTREEKNKWRQDARCDRPGLLLRTYGTASWIPLFLFVWLCSGEVAAANQQMVVPLTGPPVEAELVSVDSAGKLMFRTVAHEGTELTLPFHELVRWGNPLPPKPQRMVVVADVGRLVTAAAWAGGAPIRLEGDALIVLTDVWGEVPLPRSSVRGIVFGQRGHPRDRAHREDVVRDFAASDADAAGLDVVMLMNGDRVTGELKELSGGSLELTAKAGAVKLPLSRVEAVVLGRRQPPAVGRQPEVVVGTSDGSVLNATRVISNEKSQSVQIGSLQLSGGSVRDIVFLQLLGGAFVYLSDLEPGSYRHVPYLTIEWPFRRDRNVLGEPLSVAGQQHLKGLGMHSASRITYQLDEEYKQFDAMAAIDDSAEKKGSVTFGIYVMRNGEWKPAYASQVMRGGDSPQPISVDVGGARALTLTVDFADRGDELDHADWLDARLVKK